MCPGSKPGPSIISALRFRVVGSRPCSEETFSGFSSFPESTKIGIAKFQLDGRGFVTVVISQPINDLIYTFLVLFIEDFCKMK